MRYDVRVSQPGGEDETFTVDVDPPYGSSASVRAAQLGLEAYEKHGLARNTRVNDRELLVTVSSASDS